MHTCTSRPFWGEAVVHISFLLAGLFSEKLASRSSVSLDAFVGAKESRSLYGITIAYSLHSSQAGHIGDYVGDYFSGSYNLKA